MLQLKNIVKTYVTGDLKQRVAIARVLINNPGILLADDRPALWTAGPVCRSWSCSRRSHRISTLLSAISLSSRWVSVYHTDR